MYGILSTMILKYLFGNKVNNYNGKKLIMF